MLFQVGGQVEIRELLFAAAGLVQHRDAGHFIHPVMADAHRLLLVLIGDEVVAAVLPRHLPGADGVRRGASRLFVAEAHHPAGVDGRKEGIHAVGQVFVGALGAAIDIDLTLELAALILGGQPFQLMDELITGRFRDDPAGLDSVHQKLQLRQLERPRRHPIAAAAAPAQPDVIAQRVQRVDVAVDALSLAEDALPGQQLHQLRHIQQMLLVGLLLKDMQQRQQFGFLSLLLGHGRPPLRSRVLFVECGAALGRQAEHLFQLVPVIGHEGVPQLVQSGIELVDLSDEVLLVPEEQLRPHLLVDAGDAGQIAEGVACVLAERRVVVCTHEADGDGVAELADVADHLVVLLHRQGADVAEAQHLGQLFCPLDGLGGVLFGGGDDEVGRGKADLGGVLDAGSLTACHRVAGDELHTLRTHGLHRLHKAGLDAGDIGKDAAGLDEMAVGLEPVDEGRGVEAEDDVVGLRDEVLEIVGLAGLDIAVVESVL